jgi:hypothetical protein
MTEIPPQLAQLRGEIAQEFSEIEYEVRGSLAMFLFDQEQRPLKTYIEQFERFEKFFSPGLKLNLKVLENPDVRLADSQLAVSEEKMLANCITLLDKVASESKFKRAKELSTLLKKIKEAAKKRNLLTHSIWREIDGKIQFQNFPDYHQRQYLWIDKKGNRTRGQMEEWSTRKLRGFLTHIRNLNSKLIQIFHG